MPLGRALARDFLVQAQQPLVRQAGLGLENLQPRTQLDPGDAASVVARLGEEALASRQWRLLRGGEGFTGRWPSWSRRNGRP